MEVNQWVHGQGAGPPFYHTYTRKRIRLTITRVVCVDGGAHASPDPRRLRASGHIRSGHRCEHQQFRIPVQYVRSNEKDGRVFIREYSTPCMGVGVQRHPKKKSARKNTQTPVRHLRKCVIFVNSSMQDG